MKITQVLLSERIGGAESLARSLAEEWSDAGVENSLVFVDPAGTSHNPLARMARLRKAFIDVQADIILAHSAIPAVYARMSAPSGALKYSVLHSAGDDFQDRKLDIAERALRARTDGVVAVSADQASVYQARYGLSVPVHVIPNGIGRSFAPSPNSAQDFVEPRLISAVARLVPQKKPDLWLRAVAAVLAERRTMSAEWWGPEENEEYGRAKRRLAQDLGLDGVFRGATSSPADVYRRSDILLHTSAREAHSVGLLEAAAMGVPILCSEQVAATLPSGIRVNTFQRDDPVHIAWRIRCLLDDWSSVQDIAHEQANSVARSFSVQETARRYLATFKEQLTIRHRG